jgi:hypothetical protein
MFYFDNLSLMFAALVLVLVGMGLSVVMRNPLESGSTDLHIEEMDD